MSGTGAAPMNHRSEPNSDSDIHTAVTLLDLRNDDEDELAPSPHMSTEPIPWGYCAV